MKANKLTALILLASLPFSQFASAHAFWFAERASQLALIYGLGSDDLSTVGKLPLVEDIAGYDNEWNEVETSLRQSGPLVFVDSLPTMKAVSLVVDNGIWSQTPDGVWLAKGYDEVPDAVVSIHTMKYAVHLPHISQAPVPKIPGQLLQIIPADGYIPDMLGQPINLQVLYMGEPAVGAHITADFVNDPDAESIYTDENGMITINVRNQGLNVIEAVYETDSDMPGVVYNLENVATLSFVLEHIPE